MPGLILAVAIGLISYLLGHPFPNTIQTASNFLFWWYIASSVVLAIILFLASLGIIALQTFIGGRLRGETGAVLGLVNGSLFSFSIWIRFLFLSGLSIAGTFFIKNGIVISGESYNWLVPQLVFGGILLFLAVSFPKPAKK